MNDLLEPNILHGLNLLTIIGFVLMGIGLNQSRQGRRRAPVAFASMGIGTALVFAGLYLSHTAN